MLAALSGNAAAADVEKLRKQYREGKLEDALIEVELPSPKGSGEGNGFTMQVRWWAESWHWTDMWQTPESLAIVQAYRCAMQQYNNHGLCKTCIVSHAAVGIFIAHCQLSMCMIGSASENLLRVTSA